MKQREILKLLVRSALDVNLTDMQVAKIVDNIENSIELHELIERICMESELVGWKFL